MEKINKLNNVQFNKYGLQDNKYNNYLAKSCNNHHIPKDIFVKSNEHFVNNIAFTGIKGFKKGLIGIIRNIYRDAIFIASENRITLSKYDTPIIKDARQEIALMRKKILPTYKIQTPEREILRKNIEQEIYGNGAINKNKQAYINIGFPAAGKSTCLDKYLAKQNGALIIDFDDISKLIPEYNSGEGAYVVQDEARLILDRLIKKTTLNEDNVVISTLGQMYHRISSFCKYFKDHGYQVNLRLVDILPNKAAERAIQRYLEIGRFIDPIVYQFKGNPLNAYKKLIKKYSDVLTSYAAYSNDVPKGEPLLFLKDISSIATKD